MAFFLVLVVHASHQTVDFRKCNLEIFPMPVPCGRGATCGTRRPRVLGTTFVQEELGTFVGARHPCRQEGVCLLSSLT